MNAHYSSTLADKNKDSKVRNIDLINTYYKEWRTPQKQPKAAYTNRKKHITLRTWILFGCILGIAAVVIGYAIVSDLRHADTTTFKIKSLRPQRYSGNIIYYDYETIKQKDASITLEPQNRCAVISLDKAVDLTEATVSFDARGSSGSERIAIVFRDNKMKSNANVEDVILTPFLPADSWHTFAIKLGDISLPLDKKYITEIRFDTASNFTNNKSESTVYVKNINLGLN